MSGIENKPENYLVITYQVSGEDGNVTLKLLQENIPDEKMKTHSEENWKVLDGLKKVVEGTLVNIYGWVLAIYPHAAVTKEMMAMDNKMNAADSCKMKMQFHFFLQVSCKVEFIGRVGITYLS
jgi:hypothetical protein